MAASILKINISLNPICDNLVGFPNSGHIYEFVCCMYVYAYVCVWCGVFVYMCVYVCN